ncbi:hypothetical protein SC09_contig8orf00175 [Bacillus subtilis]|uniref:Uncharacterized protein n=1 Tax=Bacillus subtilis TaxID=1423 RepID=A0A0D1K8R0_BACIU|nr:hypothetical protein SC09_contig8orf00175 [Bacillus subtilis]
MKEQTFLDFGKRILTKEDEQRLKVEFILRREKSAYTHPKERIS